ncbi:MAG: hypothetical protein IPI33_16490, partial [Dehalococcoidia bacterium]|nr:hypothetical protein [Dehalococcoidia bacterium]
MTTSSTKSPSTRLAVADQQNATQLSARRPMTETPTADQAVSISASPIPLLAPGAINLGKVEVFVGALGVMLAFL